MKAVIVGAGHWHAGWHVSALQRRDVRIVGVWDHDPVAAARRSEEWGAPVLRERPAALSDADVAVLASRAVDAPRLLTLLLDVGLPVIAEKPLGLSGAAVSELARRYPEAFVAVTFVNRLSPVWPLVEGRRPISAEFRLVNGPPSRYREAGVEWVLDPELGGGGALRNLGIHGADAVCSLAGPGERLSVEHATLRHAPGVDVEVYARATVRSSGGWTAIVEAGYTMPEPAGSDFEWRIGADDVYVIDRGRDMIVSTPAGCRVEQVPTSADRYDTFIGRALEDLESGRPAIAGLDDATRAAVLVDGIYQSWREAPAENGNGEQ